MLLSLAIVKQRVMTLVFVLLIHTRWATAMPAGLSTPVTSKRDSSQAKFDGTQGEHEVLPRSLHNQEESASHVIKGAVTPETSEILQLRHEVQTLERELLDTREALEVLRTEVNTRLDSVGSHTEGHHEMTCRTDFTWWHEAVGKTLDFLDNFDIVCRHGEFLRQWRMTWGQQNGKKAIKFVCCSLRDTLPSR